MRPSKVTFLLHVLAIKFALRHFAMQKIFMTFDYSYIDVTKFKR